MIWDRPNTGSSGLTFEGSGAEVEMQCDFLHLLMAHIGWRPAVLWGEGAGGLLALTHALRYPDDVAGLILDSLPSGQAAARHFARKFYLEYQVRGARNPAAGRGWPPAACGCSPAPRRILPGFSPQDVVDIYNKDGMLYVARESHYARLCEPAAGALRPGKTNLNRLLSTDVAAFKRTMNRRGAHKTRRKPREKPARTRPAWRRRPGRQHAVQNPEP